MSGLLVIPGVHNSNHRNPYDSGWKHPKKTWKNLKKPYVQRAVLFEAGAGKPPFFFEEIAIESAPPLPSSSLPWSLGTVSPGASCHTICYPKEVYFGSWNTEDCLLPTNTAEASRRLNVLFLCSRFTAVQSTALFESFKTLWEHLWKRNQKSMKRGSAHALTRRLWSRLQAISLKLKWNRKDFLDSHGRWEVFQHPSYFGECLHLYIKHISSKVGFFLSQSASSLVKWFSPCLYLFLAKLSLSIIKMVVFLLEMTMGSTRFDHDHLMVTWSTHDKRAVVIVEMCVEIIGKRPVLHGNWNHDRCCFWNTCQKQRKTAMYLGAHTQSIQQPLGQAGRAENTIIRHTKRNLQPVPKGDF